MNKLQSKVLKAMLTMQSFPWEKGAASQAALEISDFETAELLARDAVLRQSNDG